MVNLNKIKQGQALPLNTIVIAILVIIVLLVIIVFFTSKMGGTNETFNKNDPTSCSPTNPIMDTLGYTDIQKVATGGCTTPKSVVNYNTGNTELPVCCVMKK